MYVIFLGCFWFGFGLGRGLEFGVECWFEVFGYWINVMIEDGKIKIGFVICKKSVKRFR